MAEENAPETTQVTPTPAKPRTPRKPRKSAAQKAAELAAAAENAETSGATEETVTTSTTPKKRTARTRTPKSNVEKTAPAVGPVTEQAVETPSEFAAPSEPAATKEPAPQEVPVTVASSENTEQRDGIDEIRALFDEADPEPEPEPVVHPLSVRGVILAPGYWQGFEGPYGRINVFAWLGLIFSFVFFPLGFIFSLIGLANAKAVPNDKFGRAIGWIGFAVSTVIAVFSLIWLLLLPFNFLLGAIHLF